MPDIEVGGKALISQSGTANPVIKSNVNFTGVIDPTATGTFSGAATGTFSGALTGATGNWGWKLLETVTASGSDDTIAIGSSTHLSSTYSTYKIIMEDLVISAATSLLSNLYIGGSVKTNNSYDFVVGGWDAANVGRKSQASQQQTYMYITPMNFDPQHADITGICGEFNITLPNLTRWHGVNWNIFYTDADNRILYAMGAGGHRKNTNADDKGALTGIRFSTASSVAITRGTLRLYGVKNA